MVRPCKNFGKGIKSYDLFRQTMGFTYKGSESYNTIPGTIGTLLIVGILISSSYSLFVSLIYRSQLNVVQSTYRINPESEEFKHTITEEESKLSFVWTSAKNRTNMHLDYYLLDPYYTKFSEENFNSTGEYHTVQSLETIVGNETNFPYDLGTYGHDGYGVDLTGKELTAGSSGTEAQYIYGEVLICAPGDNGYSDQVQEYLKNSLAKIYFEETYFDVKDLDNPVKKHVSTENYFYYLFSLETEVTFNFKRYEYELSDSIWPWAQEKSGHFYSLSINRETKREKQSDWVALSFYILLDPEVTVYKREVMSIISVFGEIGGLFEIMFSLVAIFVGLYTSWKFDASLYKTIIRYQEELKRETKHLSRISQSKSSVFNEEHKMKFEGGSIELFESELKNEVDINDKLKEKYMSFFKLSKEKGKVVDNFREEVNPVKMIYELK